MDTQHAKDISTDTVAPVTEKAAEKVAAAPAVAPTVPVAPVA